MTELSRRGFLAGLLSSAAAIAAGPVLRIIPPIDDCRFEAYTSYFRWDRDVADNWRFSTRVANIACIELPDGLRAGEMWSFGDNPSSNASVWAIDWAAAPGRTAVCGPIAP